jgi:hypothetical protein
LVHGEHRELREELGLEAFLTKRAARDKRRDASLPLVVLAELFVKINLCENKKGHRRVA